VTRKVSHENWNSFVVCSNRTATETGRSFVFSIHFPERTPREPTLVASYTVLDIPSIT